MGLKPLAIARPRSARTQIAEQVRELIVSGTLAAGERLASTQELARQWQTPVSTVQAGLQMLVREGLLDRTPRVGTFVAERTPKLTRAVVYLTRDVWADDDRAFVRALSAALVRRLEHDGCTADVLIDPRTAKQQRQPWQRLVGECRRREAHAVIAPQVDVPLLGWLCKLAAPLAIVSPTRIPNAVSFDTEQFARESLAELARQGCRSAGVVTVCNPDLPARAGEKLEDARFHEAFVQSASELGLELRPEWFVHPREGFVEEKVADRFGYEAFERLWGLRKRPQGVVVFTDVAARGVLLSVARRGIRVPDELTLVLHRNDAVGLLCPMDASFMDVNVARVADALVDSVEAQFRGEQVERVVVPYTLVRGGANQKK